MRRVTVAAAAGTVLAAPLLTGFLHSAPPVSHPASVGPVTQSPSGTQPGSPWPTMRHDVRNTGASPLPARSSRAAPWSFATERGIFATPVISADGTIYVGSADHSLYGLSPAGRQVWRFRTGGIIDTAPALLAPEPGIGPSLVVGSGDETLYRVRTGPGTPRRSRVVWRFRPTLPPVAGAQLVSWWEGSPNVGPDGTIYQGNTGGAAYAVNGDGSQRWVHQAGNAVWTVPAIDGSGTTYWGSVDLSLFALNPDGTQRWKRTTLGYVTSSPALDTAGTLYAGSFDGKLYAVDSADGSVEWAYPTGDHIYSSPALVETADGTLQQVIVGSADGLVYSLDPSGNVMWSYDTGAPIRSSPVVGQAPGGAGPPIVYVGAADGRLYALDTATGQRRWAFDTTATEPHLASRNQLNSSPALGRDGIYIGSQDGVVWGIPYDYCLRRPHDRRCVAPELPPDGMFLYGVDAGGGLVPPDQAAPISPAGYLTGRIVVRQGGRTVPARLVPAPTLAQLVTITPHVAAQASLSGDGRYVFVRPEEMLAPDTEYRVTVNGVVTTGGPRVGNVDLGTGELSAFAGSFRARTGPDGAPWRPVVAPGRVTGVSLSRLAVPLPPMLTSVNQIGFDFYDWIGGVVRTDHDATVVWFVGARRDRAGRIVADPGALFAFPVSGPVRGGTFSWNAAQVNLWFTFGPVPLRRFDLRGTFGPGGVVLPDAQFLAEAVCADIPGYGATMPATGMCDAQGVITAGGTFLGATAQSPAVRRVPGLHVGPVTLTRQPGEEASAAVQIRTPPGRPYRKADHFVSILLLDAATGRPVPLDYYGDTTMTTGADDTITGTSVRIGAGVTLPARLEAVVMTDAFPAARQTLTPETGS